MLTRVAGIVGLASGLMFVAIGMAHAVTPTAISVPELDPASIGGGITILVGSLLLLAESRRKSK
jgi:hypothetical protein